MNRDLHLADPAGNILHYSFKGVKVCRQWLTDNLVMDLHDWAEAIVLQLALGALDNLPLDLHHDVLSKLAAKGIAGNQAALLLHAVGKAPAEIRPIFGRPGHLSG